MTNNLKGLPVAGVSINGNIVQSNGDDAPPTIPEVARIAVTAVGQIVPSAEEDMVPDPTSFRSWFDVQNTYLDPQSLRRITFKTRWIVRDDDAVFGGNQQVPLPGSIVQLNGFLLGRINSGEQVLAVLLQEINVILRHGHV